MKKVTSLLFCILALALLALGTGCPPVQPVTPVVQPPVVVPPVVTPPATTGKFHIKGSLNEATKALDPGQGRVIGDALKAKAAYIGFSLGLVASTNLSSLYFQAPIVNGEYEYTSDPIEPGYYGCYVTLYDKNFFQLFSGSTTVQIVAAETAELTVLMKFADQYAFNLSVQGVPGHYDSQYPNSYTLTSIATPGSSSSNWTWTWTVDQENGRVNFLIFVPIDFPGGAIKVTDSDGAIHYIGVPKIASYIDWSTFNFGDSILMNAIPSPDGAVDVNLLFEYEQTIMANGQAFDTLQQAVDTCSSPVTIMLSAGQFEGFVIHDGKSVAVYGKGYDLTTINSPANQCSAVWASAFGNPTHTANSPDHSQMGKGGAAPADITLYGLTLVGQKVTFDQLWYSDAVVFIEAQNSLHISKCVILAIGVHGIATNYIAQQTVDYCTLYSSGGDNSIGIAAYDDDPSYIQNCIIDNFQTGVLTSNNVMQLDNCDLASLRWLYSGQPTVNNTINSDPGFLEMTWQLNPDSPCRGTGENGTDIDLRG